MPAALREFRYISSDMLESHSYNNEGNVLRFINNDTTGTEKVMVPFVNLYYYPISARYLSNIQIRITTILVTKTCLSPVKLLACYTFEDATIILFPSVDL